MLSKVICWCLLGSWFFIPASHKPCHNHRWPANLLYNGLRSWRSVFPGTWGWNCLLFSPKQPSHLPTCCTANIQLTIKCQIFYLFETINSSLCYCHLLWNIVTSSLGYIIFNSRHIFRFSLSRITVPLIVPNSITLYFLNLSPAGPACFHYLTSVPQNFSHG